MYFEPEKTYVAQLSPTAVNLALRSTPSDYPSLCLYSMIGEQMYDVIILEFSPFIAHHEDFDRLARRLRARFPSAVIIYLPIYMLLMDVMYQNRNLLKHLMSVGITSPDDPGFATTVQSLNESELTFPTSSYSIRAYRNTISSIRGHVVEFPTPHKNIKRFILDNAKYYANEKTPWDFVHPSKLGHQVIAEQIRKAISKAVTSRPPKRKVGDWLGGKDHCVSWFSNVNTTENIPKFTNMEMVDTGEGKWALEVDRKGGSLEVICLFPNCNIYVSYMAKRPSRYYPRALLSVNDQDPVLVDPYIAKFHLRRIVPVGSVTLPGRVTVWVKPLPEDATSPQRFRITGVITTPSNYKAS
jgi:hypothetical protein